MLQTLNNNLLVTIEKKLYDTVTFESGITLHIDPNWHPEEFAMLTATVVSVPRGVIDRYDYAGMTCDILPGDKILMRYDVVFAYKDQPDRATPIYKNMIMYFNDEAQAYEEYWLCDLQKVFAVVAGDSVIMKNGYVMVLPVHKKPSGRLIWTPEDHDGSIYDDRVEIQHMGLPLIESLHLDLKPGDVVSAPAALAQKYNDGKKAFWIIKQSHILGKLT